MTVRNEAQPKQGSPQKVGPPSHSTYMLFTVEQQQQQHLDLEIQHIKRKQPPPSLVCGTRNRGVAAPSIKLQSPQAKRVKTRLTRLHLLFFYTPPPLLQHNTTTTTTTTAICLQNSPCTSRMYGRISHNIQRAPTLLLHRATQCYACSTRPRTDHCIIHLIVSAILPPPPLPRGCLVYEFYAPSTSFLTPKRKAKARRVRENTTQPTKRIARTRFPVKHTHTRTV